MIKAEILLDSIGEDGSAPRLTTWLLTIPRCVLAELNTHRAASRNCPSSRAIPVMKRLKMVWNDLFSPIEWGLDRPGMQAGALATGWRLRAAKATWKLASIFAIACAWIMVKLGVHKQVANRLLEPFVWVTDLVTFEQTGEENFLALRAEKSADPHMQRLAYLMIEAKNASVPQVLKPGEWHIPYGDRMYPGLTWEQKIKVAVARCARVSFNSFDGKNEAEKDFILHDVLAKQGHWSSFEHIAQVPVASRKTFSAEELTALRNHVDEAKADPDYTICHGYPINWDEIGVAPKNLGGNLVGWIQLRKTYPNECRVDSRIPQVKPPSPEMKEIADSIVPTLVDLGYIRILTLYCPSTPSDLTCGLIISAVDPTGRVFVHRPRWFVHLTKRDARRVVLEALSAFQSNLGKVVA